MNRIKLLSYQIKDIKQRLYFTYDKVETDILNKYKAYAVEDLNATDYEEIIEDIQDWTCELNAKYEGL